MFHYRLAPSNNRPRMLIAVLLAIALHMGLMNFEFEQKPVSVPGVSLPRSVSVFLQQSSMEQSPDEPVKESSEITTIKEDNLNPVINNEAAVIPENPTEMIQPENSFQAKPLLLEKKAHEPHVEEIAPARQEPTIETQDTIPEAAEATKIQESSTQVEPLNVQEKEGVNLPGTVQMAYPRYQLNKPPGYPALARKRGHEGTVLLQVFVDREGRVNELKIETSSNFRLLDRAALAAVRTWSFEPGRQGGERVPMWVRVPVSFKLKN